MAGRFFQKFRRITYSTSYLPEVDGLRFLAIFSVVVIMHITGYLNQKFYGDSFITDEYWQQIVLGGGGGVSLFFMISGFILSLPFAGWRFKNGKKVSLRHYYLRRLTRLEPPYILALILLFIAQVWLLGKYSFDQLLPHFFASVFYVHTFIYDSFSWILPVAWSLEVEVQFYLLAPIFFTIFLIPHKWWRWLICLVIIITGAIYWANNFTTPHVFKFLHFFFCGILLADHYTNGVMIIKNQRLALFVGIAALAGYIFIPSIISLEAYLLRVACMFLLFHTVLTNPLLKKIFSMEFAVIIGGMCYSIYLLHFAIVAFTGQLLLRSGIQWSDSRLFIPLAILMAAMVLLFSSIYFILVEKPFMKPFSFLKR